MNVEYVNASDLQEGDTVFHPVRDVEDPKVSAVEPLDDGLVKISYAPREGEEEGGSLTVSADTPIVIVK